jgi:dTDP-4-dehydrorhamnose reductase
MSSSSRNSVVRIASVFGAAGSSGKGGNFVEAITAQLRGGKRPVVVAEGRMSPTYTLYAAGFIAEVIARNLSGIFHGANQGSASWFDFADQIARFTGHEGQVDPILGDWDAIPSRPRNSSLAISRLEKFDQPSWQVALSAYLTEKGYLQ